MVELKGNLAFGNVETGKSATSTLTISNTGNAALTISGITLSASSSVFSTNWTHGTIQPGASQIVAVQFAPAAAQTYSATLTVNGDQTSGTNTAAVSGTGLAPATTPPTTQTEFGDGQYLVGTQILAGRYYVAPGSGCEWVRESGTDGTPTEVIASRAVGFSAAQWIVDILATDHAFKSTSCGRWFKDSPRTGAQTSIPKGMWLVGSQITPGIYTADVQPGCYWERLRDFQGTPSSVIASNLLSSSGTVQVTIVSSDVGFASNASCGTWSRVGP